MVAWYDSAQAFILQTPVPVSSDPLTRRLERLKVLYSLDSYAADGDRDENLSGIQGAGRQSRLGEAEKLAGLEEEVRSYPG